MEKFFLELIYESYKTYINEWYNRKVDKNDYTAILDWIENYEPNENIKGILLAIRKEVFTV